MAWILTVTFHRQSGSWLTLLVPCGSDGCYQPLAHPPTLSHYLLQSHTHDVTSTSHHPFLSVPCLVLLTHFVLRPFLSASNPVHMLHHFAAHCPLFPLLSPSLLYPLHLLSSFDAGPSCPPPPPPPSPPENFHPHSSLAGTLPSPTLNAMQRTLLRRPLSTVEACSASDVSSYALSITCWCVGSGSHRFASLLCLSFECLWHTSLLEALVPPAPGGGSQHTVPRQATKGGGGGGALVGRASHRGRFTRVSDSAPTCSCLCAHFPSFPAAWIPSLPLLSVVLCFSYVWPEYWRIATDLGTSVLP